MIVDLIALKSTEIKIKALQVKDEIIGHIFETRSAYD